jgi:aminomethyltransferase
MDSALLIPAMDAAPLRTPLHDLHLEHQGRMTPFAGYDLPVQYADGIMAEHRHTRAAAGLFDVSHMGQIELWPRSGDLADAALALERLVPANIAGLKAGRQTYALFTNDAGGIDDDLMVANLGDRLFLVVNAACKQRDAAHLRAHLGDACEVVERADFGLIALQGPLSEAVLASLNPRAAQMEFMDAAQLELAGVRCTVTRSGYTGEDGYEIGAHGSAIEALARAILAAGNVKPVGLGARDSLRLEAGLCLYGSDLNSKTSPVEAALEWSIPKVRRPGGARAGGYPGADLIDAQLNGEVQRRRVGLRPEGRAPVRGGAPLFAEADGPPIGEVTSGCFSPTLNAPVAMGYVAVDHAQLGAILYAEVRGARLPVTVTAMPVVPKTYRRPTLPTAASL